jgi:hypothetical protein
LDFELSAEDMDAISELNEGESLFFNHRDPEMVKQLGETEYDIRTPARLPLSRYSDFVDVRST